MKQYLKNIERRFDTEDKFKYDYVLNQSERTQHLPDNLYQEFLGSLKQEDFFFYPNTEKFKEKICEFYGVENDQLFLCAGSDLGIKSVFETFTDGGRVITSDPSFPMYKVYSELYQCEYFGIPHEKDYTISMEKILSNITNDTDLVILANPNSPMGEYKSFDEIRILLEQDVPVLIDEAYIEFSDRDSLINEINNYSNLLITRTFSKGFGAAGCRVGMVFSSSDNMELISKFRPMHPITGVSTKYCEFLLDNYSVVSEYVEGVKQEKKKMIYSLSEVGFEIIDSNCNWVHFNDETDNIKLKRVFDKYKVLAKYCSVPHDNRKNWCRLSIVPSMSKFEFFKEVLRVESLLND